MSEPSTIITLACADLPPPHATETCRACSCTVGYLARYIHVDGRESLRWVCEWCEDYKTASDLPRALVDPDTFARLPVRASNHDPDRERLDCVVCGQPAGEMHHWAPTSIFPDWPIAKEVEESIFGGDSYVLFLPALVVPMCVEHHREWHDRMRAHGLRWPHEIEEAA